MSVTRAVRLCEILVLQPLYPLADELTEAQDQGARKLLAKLVFREGAGLDGADESFALSWLSAGRC